MSRTPVRKGDTQLGAVLLVLLGLAWAAVLVPAVIGPRLHSSPAHGVRRFESAMGVLANARRGTQGPGRWVMVPRAAATRVAGTQRRRTRVIARRRKNFERLVFAAAATFILGLVPPLRALLWVHLAVDAGLVLYVMQLRRWKVVEDERMRRLRSAERTEQALPEVDHYEDVPVASVEADDGEEIILYRASN